MSVCHAFQVPLELEALWGVAREWHLLQAHYDVFGVNIPWPGIPHRFEVEGVMLSKNFF